MAETILVHDPDISSPGFPSEQVLGEVQALIDLTEQTGGSPLFEEIKHEYQSLAIAEGVLRGLAGN